MQSLTKNFTNCPLFLQNPPNSFLFRFFLQVSHPIGKDLVEILFPDCTVATAHVPLGIILYRVLPSLLRMHLQLFPTLPPSPYFTLEILMPSTQLLRNKGVNSL